MRVEIFIGYWQPGPHFRYCKVNLFGQFVAKFIYFDRSLKKNEFQRQWIQYNYFLFVI